jgi:hypothetical protein
MDLAIDDAACNAAGGNEVAGCRRGRTMRMKAAGRTETATLIVAMRELSLEIISDDGVANAAISEAGDRLGEQAREISALRQHLEVMVTVLERLRTARENKYANVESRSGDMVYVSGAIDSARAFLDRPR